MSIGGFILRNALRNKRRLLLSVLSAAISLFLFVVLMILLRELTVPLSDGGAAQRLAIRNKVSLGSPLPIRQLSVMAQIPGLEVVMPMTWIQGKFQENDPALRWPQFAVDPKKFRQIFPDAIMTDKEWSDWEGDRRSCIVGADTAKDKEHPMKVGQKIHLISGIYPCELELTVVGIYHGTINDAPLWFHDAYFQTAMNDWGKVGSYWARVTDPSKAGEVSAAIEAAFANTADEVRAETEHAFIGTFVGMWGNISTLIGGIASAVTVTLLLVTASTMSMAIRERFRELAILKALGFRRRELYAFIVAESFTLVGLGTLIGVGGAWALATYVPIKEMSGGMFISFEASPQILGLAVLIACGLAIFSTIFPGIAVSRMSVVEGLKTLD
jgi:putative ABC transport system permease protein